MRKQLKLFCVQNSEFLLFNFNTNRVSASQHPNIDYIYLSDFYNIIFPSKFCCITIIVQKVPNECTFCKQYSERR